MRTSASSYFFSDAKGKYGRVIFILPARVRNVMPSAVTAVTIP